MDEKRVYVVAKGFHSWEAAAQHGKLIFLSTDAIGRTAVSNMLRQFLPELEKSNPDDLIVITGLSVMCSLACSIFARKHGRLNLLLYDASGDKYVRRTVLFPEGERES